MAINPSLLIIPDRFKASKLYSQLPESGDGDFTVVRGTTATRVNASGLIESVASGVPRLDYTGGGCPSLLVEPAATNLLLRSEEFDNAYWAKAGITVSGNTSVAPDGATTADTIVEDSAAATQHRISRTLLSFTSGTTYTISAFVKRGIGSRNCQLGLSDGASFIRVYFDLTNGIVGTQTNGTGTIQSFGNGWFRVTATGTATTTTAAGIAFLANTNATTTGSETYNGDGVSSILWWGAQLETGSVATSYIPTVASTVTRNADVISLSSASGLIGQTEGTLFIEFNALQLLDVPEITLDDATNNNRIALARNPATSVWGIFSASAGVGGVTFGTSTGNSGKFALAYSSDQYVLFRNGVQIATRTAALPVSLSAIRLNGRATSDLFGNKSISAAAIYTTRLSDPELIALTSL